tara:strand:- start:449 stop:637 length:189 start_codon:yes stop_codon:yes gene_type:complete
MTLDIETVREVKRLIDKKINNISEQIIYGTIDNYEKLQYSRGQISSLSQLKEDLSELLRDEE